MGKTADQLGSVHITYRFKDEQTADLIRKAFEEQPQTILQINYLKDGSFMISPKKPEKDNDSITIDFEIENEVMYFPSRDYYEDDEWDNLLEVENLDDDLVEKDGTIPKFFSTVGVTEFTVDEKEYVLDGVDNVKERMYADEIEYEEYMQSLLEDIEQNEER